MKFKEAQGGYFVRLFKGEKIMENLISFFREHDITSGVLQGIGGATNAELGFYDIDEKKYIYKTFDEILEIVNLAGNISSFDGQPFIHAHIVISDRNFNCFGGHLKEAVVGATCEIFLRDINIPLSRKIDDEIGLKLLDLEEV